MNQKIITLIVKILRFCILSIILLILLSACAGPQVQQADLNVIVYDNGDQLGLTVSAGSTVRDTIESSNIEISVLDRSDPPFYTVVSEGMEIRIIRVTEEYWIEESVIPYETKIIRDSELPEGEQRLMQPGVNGLQETTYRKVFENGVEVSEGIVKVVTVDEADDEIIRVGSQTPLEVFSISGKIAYISGGNAWLMEGNTGSRRPIVLNGNLDGWVFEISPDGKWLLFSQSEESEETINSMWVVNLIKEGDPIQMNIENVIHFAAWIPDESYGILYSTVEKSLASPGWQAHNNLIYRSFNDEEERVSPPILLVEENTDGLYSWWGADFKISPDGDRVLIIKPDGIQLYDLDDQILIDVFNFSPYQTSGDWAWVPDLSWNQNSKSFFYTGLADENNLSDEPGSTNFEIKFYDLESDTKLTLVESVGIFGSPILSPEYNLDNGETQVFIAYMQGLQASDSVNSEYRLNLVDIDGSNQESVFPEIGLPGLDPQGIEWSNEGDPMIALLYHGNIWVIDIITGDAYQLTADGMTLKIDWK